MMTTGCFDNDPGLQERLVRTQAELQEKTRRLQETEAALEKARTVAREPRPAETPAAAATTASATPTPAMLSREQLEETYVASAKEMRRKVEAELKGYAVENCTLFRVDMPSVALPYTSKVALNLRSDAGQPYRLEFPVGADWSGKWTFPATGDVVTTLDKVRAQAATAAPPSPRSPSAPASAPRGGGPATASRPAGRSSEGPANTSVETIELGWGNNRSPGVAAPRRPPAGGAAPSELSGAPGPATAAAPRTAAGQPQLPPSPAAPEPPATAGPPKPAMQSDRDVLIQF